MHTFVLDVKYSYVAMKKNANVDKISIGIIKINIRERLNGIDILFNVLEEVLNLNKYYFEENHVRKEIRDIEIIRKICKAANLDKWHDRYGAEFIKVESEIYQYRDLGNAQVLNLVSGEFLKEMRRQGMVFKNDDLSSGTEEVDGLIKFII